MVDDDENGKFIKMKIVLNRHILILMRCYLEKGKERDDKEVDEEEDATISNELGE